MHAPMTDFCLITFLLKTSFILFVLLVVNSYCSLALCVSLNSLRSYIKKLNNIVLYTGWLLESIHAQVKPNTYTSIYVAAQQLSTIERAMVSPTWLFSMSRMV